MNLDIIGMDVEHGKKGSIQAWMDAGYSIFSLEGPSSVQIERLARSLNKNKSGFYFFFKDREFFLQCLMKEHLKRLNAMTRQIREIQYFDPEYFNFMINHKEEIFVQIQLIRNREIELYQGVLSLFDSRISAAVIPVWSDYLNSSIEMANKLWGMSRDTLYCRATSENFSFAWLQEMAGEARQVAGFHHTQAIAL